MKRRASPQEVRCKITAVTTASPRAHKNCAGINPPTRPTNRAVNGSRRTKGKATASPPESNITQPRQRKSNPIVTTIEGTPVRTTTSPLIRPMPAPAASPATRPAAADPVDFATTANRKLDIAMFEAKDRSISPATTTRVIPIATIATKGMVVMNER